MGYWKAARLKQEDIDAICGNVFDFFDGAERFSASNKITASRLREDDDHLKHLVIGKVDKHRQGGFVA